MSEIKAAGLGLAQREKFWGELTTEEKVERTRMQVRNMLERFQRLENRIWSLERNFRQHQHINEKVVLSIDSGFGECDTPSGRIGRINEDLSNVYF